MSLMFALLAAMAPPVTVEVTAKAETVPVGTANADAADDPAIWRNPGNPAASLIVATDKKAGLYVYGLDGKVRDFVGAGRLNNVDLIDRGRAGLLVVASDRNDEKAAKLRLYTLDPATAKLAELGVVSGGAGEAYGVCFYEDKRGLYVFSVLKEGAVHQVRLTLGQGAPSGTIVRTVTRYTQPEGCVADARTRSLFVGEEDVGIWRFDASETASVDGRLVAPVDGRQLVADVEGLAIAGRMLIASSQGDNSYALYTLPSMKPAGRFRVARGSLGSTEETDGIAFAGGSFGPDYPQGLFVAQDGENAPAAQNFKLVSWREVRKALKAAR